MMALALAAFAGLDNTHTNEPIRLPDVGTCGVMRKLLQSLPADAKPTQELELPPSVGFQAYVVA